MFVVVSDIFSFLLFVKSSSSEAHLDDIFLALNKQDSINKLPTFVSKNIDRIPDRQQEENNI